MKSDNKLNSIVLAAVFVLALAGLASAQSLPPADGLADLGALPEVAGYWRMNEAAGTTAFDSSLHQNHGQVVGNASLEPDALVDGVLTFTGEGGHLVVPHQPNLEPEQGTVLLWIKIDSVEASDIFFKLTDEFVRTGFVGKRMVYGLRLLPRGDLQGCVADDDPESSTPWSCAYVRAPLRLGQWHMIALRWDGRMVTLFLDGHARNMQRYTPVPGSGLSYSGSNPLMVGGGGSWGTGVKYFKGQTSNLVVFERALSDQEIRDAAGGPR